MKPILIALLALWVFVSPAAGFEIDTPLTDPALEQRARDLHKALRCLVCQNQSIVDSDADLARDLRRVVRERVVAGDSDDDVLRYMVDRYGDWVLLRPPFKLSTLALWLMPFAVLAIAGFGVFRWLRRPRPEAAGAAPLDAAEQDRLTALLDDETAR